MTISAWVNSAAFPADDAAIVSKRDSASNGYQLDTTIDKGPRTTGFKLTSSSGANMVRYGNTAMITGQWYYVTGVYNAAAQTMDVYLNGVLDNGVLVGTVSSSQQNSTLPVTIGKRSGMSGFEFNGRIDEVQIYNRALTVSEIQTEMNNSGGSPDTTAPSVSLTAPSGGSTVNGTVTISAAASDNVGVGGVQFYLDGTALGAEDTSTPYNFSWNSAAVANGSHTLTAVARDYSGNTTTSSAVQLVVNNVPDTTAPTVSLTAPVGGATLSGVAIVSANASDNVGVVGVQFFLDGNVLGAEDTTSPYSVSWTTNPASNGTHTLFATARDAAGNITTSAAVVITVNNTAVSDPTTLPLLTQSNLQYLGSFKLPNGQIGSSTFNYGGTAIAFNPNNNSLFIVGHPYDQQVAEVKIPANFVNSSQLSALPTATMLQPFTNVLGKLPPLTTATPVDIGGLQVVNGQLIGTAYGYYDTTGIVDSHFRLSSLDLASAGVSGFYQVGNLGGGLVGGYMTAIPAEWQQLLGAPYITGQAALNIITRTSSGPAAFGFNPNNLGSTTTSAIPYAYYDTTHSLGDIGTNNPYFTGNTSITGAFFAPGSRSVFFFGSNGTNTVGYGEAATFNDPFRGGKGWHSQNGDYSYEVWAYDANDLLAVKNGAKQPWEIRPYQTWYFDFPAYEGTKFLGGVAFDPATGRLYVSQLKADTSANPLIQVYQLTISNQLNAESMGSDLAAPTLTQADAEPILKEALTRWQAFGADVSKLTNISLQVTDLNATMLGMAANNTIWLDANAAANGWFIDPTPEDDSEFTTAGDQGEQGKIDLLSVVFHEIGHLLGYEHELGTAMDELLKVGNRSVS